MKFLRRLLPAAAALALTATTTRAVLLVPDTVVPLPGTTLVARPELGGTVIASDLTSFSFPIPAGTISGQIASEVVRETVAGTLDFYWQVFIDPASAGNLGSFRLGSFFTDTYDADWRADGVGTTPPDYGYLFSGGLGYVNFGFDTDLTPADGSSRLMFLHTDAIDYAAATDMDVAIPGFGYISDTYRTFGPIERAGVIPELGTSGFGLAVCGLTLFAVRANRRRR